MREQGDSTPQGGGAPAVNEHGLDFCRDDHPLLRLKQALDWAALQHDGHPLAHGCKNVDGEPGRPCCALVCAFIGLDVVKVITRTDGGLPQRERCGAALLDLPHPQMMHVRDHSNIAEPRRH